MSHILSVQELCTEGAGQVSKLCLLLLTCALPAHLSASSSAALGALMVRIHQGLGHQHLGLKPVRAKSTQQLWKSMLWLFLGYLGGDNYSRKAGGQGRRLLASPALCPCAGRTDRQTSPCGTGAPPAVLTPLCPLSVEWLRTQRNGFLWQERRKASPCFDLIS